MATDEGGQKRLKELIHVNDERVGPGRSGCRLERTVIEKQPGEFEEGGKTLVQASHDDRMRITHTHLRKQRDLLHPLPQARQAPFIALVSRETPEAFNNEAKHPVEGDIGRVLVIADGKAMLRLQMAQLRDDIVLPFEEWQWVLHLLTVAIRTTLPLLKE